MMTIFSGPRGFTPNESGDIQVLPLNALCTAMLYVETLTSPGTVCSQRVSVLLPFADKDRVSDATVLILCACNIRDPCLSWECSCFISFFETPGVSGHSSFLQQSFHNLDFSAATSAIIWSKSMDIKTNRDPPSWQSRRPHRLPECDESAIFKKKEVGRLSFRRQMFLSKKPRKIWQQKECWIISQGC